MTTVRETQSLNASADDVWSVIGDFGGLHNWHPAVAACEVIQEGPARIRHLTLGDGSKIVERLDAHDGATKSYTYSITDAGPLPVANYQSTIQVTGDGDSATVNWHSEFDPSGASEADAQGAISGVYTGGFAALVVQFG